MARVKGGVGSSFSGNLANMVFVSRGERTYVRVLPRERKPSEWSADQKIHRNGFSVLSKFASRIMKSSVKPIWTKAAPEYMSGYNLFLKTNKGAFDQQGNLISPEMLHFSAGSLPLPSDLNAKFDGGMPGIIDVSWNNELCSRVRGIDELMVLFYSADKLMEPFATGFLRRGEHAQIALPENPGEEICLYLFFRSNDQSEYSNDQSFSLTVD